MEHAEFAARVAEVLAILEDPEVGGLPGRGRDTGDTALAVTFYILALGRLGLVWGAGSRRHGMRFRGHDSWAESCHPLILGMFFV